MTDMYAEVLDDLDDAIERLSDATSERLQRRAMREAIGHLYSLREHHRGRRPKTFYRIANADPDGRTLEGVVLVRTVLVHDLARPVGPTPDDVYTDAYTATYDPLVWRRLVEMDLPLPKKLDAKRAETNDGLLRIKAYEDHVAGLAVVDTLNDARRFLVSQG
jgi:hypothetical protein